MNKNGLDLLKTFEELHTVLGKFDENSVKAWFDADCKDTVYLLNWLCTLNKFNCLTPIEKQEYDDSVRNTFSECHPQWPNTLPPYSELSQIEYNLRDVELLEQEVLLLTGQDRELSLQLDVQKEIYNDIIGNIRELNDLLLQSNVQKDMQYQNCLELCQKLDNYNENLCSRIENLNALFNNFFEVEDRSLFISNMDMMDLKNVYDTVLSSGAQVLNDTNSLADSYTNNDLYTQEITLLRDRLSQSEKVCLSKKVDETRLRSELNFLKCLDPIVLHGTHTAVYNLETSIGTKEKLLLTTTLAVEQLTNKVIKAEIDRPVSALAKKDLNEILKQLEKFNLVKRYINKLLVIMLLFYHFHEIEQDDISNTEDFFRNVLHYITKDLRSCQLRCDTMLDINNEYEKHANTTYQRNAVIRCITFLLSQAKSTDVSLSTALSISNKYKDEKNLLDRTLFYNDFSKHQELCHNIENSINSMKSFLLSGPTTIFSAIPHELFHGFKDIDCLLMKQKKSLMSSIELPKIAKKKESHNKWAVVRRQLWMYFLTEPAKVVSMMEEIKTKIIETMNSVL